MRPTYINEVGAWEVINEKGKVVEKTRTKKVALDIAAKLSEIYREEFTIRSNREHRSNNSLNKSFTRLV